VELKNKVVLAYLSHKIASLDYVQEGSFVFITDDLGGRAQIKREGNLARIIDIQSVPFGKRYTPEEDSFKKRGFFRGVLKTLSEHGVRTITVRLQSQDTRAALKRLVETGALINPRDIAGISVNEYPTTFDIV
jgi:hypothetical protein